MILWAGLSLRKLNVEEQSPGTGNLIKENKLSGQRNITTVRFGRPAVTRYAGC